MNATILVFVYGTLRKGFGNHRRLGDCALAYKGAFWQEGFKMIDLGAFPGAVKTDNPEDMIWVEAYQVDMPTLIHSLDVLEGHPRFYERIKTHSGIGTGWIYTLPAPKYPNPEYVESGKWGEA